MDVLRRLALFALVTAIFSYGFYTFLRVQPSADIDTHISYAEQIQTFRDLTSPHFLFQLTLKALHALGLTYAASAVWVLGLCYGGMALLIAGEAGRRGIVLTPFREFVLIPAVLLACHIFLPTILRPNLYYGYLTPISWHNPTQQPNKLFTLWIYYLYCAGFLDGARARASRVAAMGGLSVLSALAKPSFLVAFLPTAGLFALADLARRRWRQVALFAVGIALPTTLVLLWQARVAYGTSAPTSVVFVPFVVWNFEATLYKLPASLAFPIVVGAIAWRERSHDPKIQFTTVFTVIALFVTFCLGEAGPRLMEGNFAWTGQTAVFLAYVEALLFMLAYPGTTRARRLAWVLFGLHVLCGLIWYGANFSDARVPSL